MKDKMSKKSQGLLAEKGYSGEIFSIRHHIYIKQ